MDCNEHIYDGLLGKALADKDGLGLIEAVSLCTGEAVGATFYCGTCPIYGLWVSSDLAVSNACLMPLWCKTWHWNRPHLDTPLPTLPCLIQFQCVIILDLELVTTACLSWISRSRH